MVDIKFKGDLSKVKASGGNGATSNKLPHEMNWNELMEMRDQLLTQEEEIKSALDVIKEEIIIKLDDEQSNGKVIGDKSISIITTYTTDKETAKELGAITTVTQQRIDTKKIKELHLAGVVIENLEINKRPLIKTLNADPKEVQAQ